MISQYILFTHPCKYLQFILSIHSFNLFSQLTTLHFLSSQSTSVNRITYEDFIFKNLIPVTLGNIVGGAGCVGLGYSSVYGSLLDRIGTMRRSIFGVLSSTDPSPTRATPGNYLSLPLWSSTPPPPFPRSASFNLP